MHTRTISGILFIIFATSSSPLHAELTAREKQTLLYFLGVVGLSVIVVPPIAVGIPAYTNLVVHGQPVNTTSIFGNQIYMDPISAEGINMGIPVVLSYVILGLFSCFKACRIQHYQGKLCKNKNL